jgi:hypothetical protein
VEVTLSVVDGQTITCQTAADRAASDVLIVTAEDLPFVHRDVCDRAPDASPPRDRWYLEPD